MAALTTPAQGAPTIWAALMDSNGNPNANGGPPGDAIGNPPSIPDVLTFAEVWNGQAWDKLRTDKVFKTIATVATGNSIVWTPTSGFRFRLKKFMIVVPANTVAAAAAILEITLNDSGTNLNLGTSVFIPSAAGTTFGSGFNTGWIDLGNGALSASANNLLQVNLSFALTGGEVRIVTAGTEE